MIELMNIEELHHTNVVGKITNTEELSDRVYRNINLYVDILNENENKSRNEHHHEQNLKINAINKYKRGIL